jgi:5'-3' exonuclease
LEYGITILFDNIEAPVTRNNFFYYFNYHYSNALTMKIICGDVSDNIQGIAGLKEKTLLKHFPEMQFRKMTVREICGKADEINQQRVAEKKKPLKALEALLDNIDRLKMNYRLINLNDPFLNDEAIEELAQLEMSLDPNGRGSKNLLKMMNEDEYLTVYNSTFVNYVEPFYTVIMNEKQEHKAYKKKNRGVL